MKDDLISRKAAIGAIMAHEMEEIDEKRKWYNHGLLDAEIEVLDLPTAQSKPKKGKWIKRPDIKSFRKTNVPVFECSNCNGIFCDIVANQDFYRYCPYCGAEMRGEEK